MLVINVSLQNKQKKSQASKNFLKLLRICFIIKNTLELKGIWNLKFFLGHHVFALLPSSAEISSGTWSTVQVPVNVCFYWLSEKKTFPYSYAQITVMKSCGTYPQ